MRLEFMTSVFVYFIVAEETILWRHSIGSSGMNRNIG